MNFIKTVLWCSLFLSFGLQAQESNCEKIPPAVHQEFVKRYPNMFAYDWEYKKKSKLYRADFIDNGNEWKAYFNADGSWLKSETEIDKTKLPQAIWSSLSKGNYQNWKVDDIDLMQTPQYKAIYQLEMKNGKQKKYLYFLPNGSEVTL